MEVGHRHRNHAWTPADFEHVSMSWAVLQVFMDIREALGEIKEAIAELNRTSEVSIEEFKR
jgi:hypothetical protein